MTCKHALKPLYITPVHGAQLSVSRDCNLNGVLCLDVNKLLFKCSLAEAMFSLCRILSLMFPNLTSGWIYSWQLHPPCKDPSWTALPLACSAVTMVFFISVRLAGLIPQRSATSTILSRFFTSSLEVAGLI